MTTHSELHTIMCVVLSSFVAIYILHDDPLAPLALAHIRDLSDVVATSTAGAPTKTPVQCCLEMYVHFYW